MVQQSTYFVRSRLVFIIHTYKFVSLQGLVRGLARLCIRTFTSPTATQQPHCTQCTGCKGKIHFWCKMNTSGCTLIQWSPRTCPLQPLLLHSKISLFRHTSYTKHIFWSEPCTKHFFLFYRKDTTKWDLLKMERRKKNRLIYPLVNRFHNATLAAFFKPFFSIEEKTESYPFSITSIFWVKLCIPMGV